MYASEYGHELGCSPNNDADHAPNTDNADNDHNAKARYSNTTVSQPEQHPGPDTDTSTEHDPGCGRMTAGADIRHSETDEEKIITKHNTANRNGARAHIN